MKGRSALRSKKFTPFDEVQEGIFRDFPEAAALWQETEPQRAITFMLVQLRKSKGFSAKQIAERTGWDKAFVSRLESGLNGFPDAVTVARYAEACGATAGVVIGEPTESCHFRVLGAVTLHSGLQEERVNSFERLADKKLRLSAPPFKAL